MKDSDEEELSAVGLRGISFADWSFSGNGTMSSIEVLLVGTGIKMKFKTDNA